MRTHINMHKQKLVHMFTHTQIAYEHAQILITLLKNQLEINHKMTPMYGRFFDMTQTLKHITHTQTNKLTCLSDILCILCYQLKGLVDNNEYNSLIHNTTFIESVANFLHTCMSVHTQMCHCMPLTKSDARNIPHRTHTDTIIHL